MMTPQQLTAIAHPCLMAFETAHPRFSRPVKGGDAVLTVNAGYE